jgi:hypothetical protein
MWQLTDVAAGSRVEAKVAQINPRNSRVRLVAPFAAVLSAQDFHHAHQTQKGAG